MKLYVRSILYLVVVFCLSHQITSAENECAADQQQTVAEDSNCPR
jgi:hypothetical protein